MLSKPPNHRYFPSLPTLLPLVLFFRALLVPKLLRDEAFFQYFQTRSPFKRSPSKIMGLHENNIAQSLFYPDMLDGLYIHSLFGTSFLDQAARQHVKTCPRCLYPQASLLAMWCTTLSNVPSSVPLPHDKANHTLKFFSRLVGALARVFLIGLFR